MQADKEIRKEKEIKRKFSDRFFFPFPPLLSNISVISPQTGLWMHFHVPHTNQTAEISKLPSQAPNKGFKIRTGYGTAQLNLPLLQLYDPPPPHPGAYVLCLCPAVTMQDEIRCPGEVLLVDLRTPGPGTTSLLIAEMPC